MKRRTVAIAGTAVVVAVAFFIFAPTIYSPTTVYGPLVYYNEVNPRYPTYPNWESPSCWAFGFGVYYGRTAQLVAAYSGGGLYGSVGAMTFKYGNATQFGCPPASTSLP